MGKQSKIGPLLYQLIRKNYLTFVTHRSSAKQEHFDSDIGDWNFVTVKNDDQLGKSFK